MQGVSIRGLSMMISVYALDGLGHVRVRLFMWIHIGGVFLQHSIVSSMRAGYDCRKF